MPLRRASAFLTLLLAAPLLAGCFSGPLSDGAGAPLVEARESGGAGDALVAPTFLAPVFLGTMELGAEPSVAVAPNGTAYVTTPLALWRSFDLGHTWTTVGTQRDCIGFYTCTGRHSGIEGGGDASLVVTSDAKLHWLGLFGDTENVPYQRSSDMGQSWTPGVDLGPGARNSTDRQWISADDDDTLYAVWRHEALRPQDCINALGVCYVRPDASPNETIAVSVSTDGGLNWTRRAGVPGDAITGPVATDPSSGAIYLPANGDGLHVYRSLDQGATWNKTTLRAGVPTFGLYIFPSAAVDEAGNVYVVWSEDPDNDVPNPGTAYGFGVPRAFAVPKVFMSVSTDGGVTYSQPRLLSDPARPAVFPWIAAGDEGRIVVAWYDAVLPTPGERVPNAWNVAVSLSVDGHNATNATFVTAFANPRPIHLGPLCTSGTLCTLTAGDRSLLDFFEVRLLPDGSPILSYAADADLRLATVEVWVTRMVDGTRLRE